MVVVYLLAMEGGVRNSFSATIHCILGRYDGLRYGHRVDLASVAEANKVDQGALHRFYTLNRTQGFGPEVQRRILTGCYVLSAKAYAAYYERALAARAKLKGDFLSAMAKVDVLLTPTTPTGPFTSESPAEPAALLLNDIMTIPVNLVGAPAISVPVDVKPSRLHGLSIPVPVGLQIIGRPLDEAHVFRVARALESSAKFSAKIPSWVTTATWQKST